MKFRVDGNNDTITAGSTGTQTLSAEGANDVVIAGGGHDTLIARGTNDILQTGTNADTLFGNPTSTLIFNTAASLSNHFTDFLVGGKIQVDFSETQLEQLAVKTGFNTSTNPINLAGLQKYLAALTSSSTFFTDYSHKFGLNFVGVANKSISYDITNGPVAPNQTIADSENTNQAVNLFTGVTDPGNLALQTYTIVTQPLSHSHNMEP